MVGFGLDLSALQKDAPEAFRILNAQTLGMSAEMKRASREGAESFRLIDEALGIHVSRPLTRILTQEFPALAKGLQAVLGVGIAGAVGAVIIEGFEKAARAIEKAQKAEEEFAEASRKSGEVFSGIIQSYEKAATLRSLSGLDKKLFEIDTSSIEKGKKQVDELVASFKNMEKAAVEAHGFWTEMLAGIGNVGHVLSTKPTDLRAEELGKQFGEVLQQYNQLAGADALKNTHEGAKLIAEELVKANALLDTMAKKHLTGMEEFVENHLPSIGPKGETQFSDAEIAKATEYRDLLLQINTVLTANTNDRKAGDDEARVAESARVAAEAIREAQGDMKGWNEEANKGWQTWSKVNEELEKAIGNLGSTALSESAERWKEFQKINGPMVTVAPPPGAPQLADQVELHKVTDDQNESWKKAGEILQEIETPAQKYATALQVLRTLEDQGRLSAEQVALATQKLGEEMTKAELKVQEMEKELEKLLSHSTSAADGMKAFFLQLQIESSQNGRMAFQLLNDGLKSFEDALTKAVFTGKAQWKEMFRSMAEEAFKFMLNKDIANLFKMIGGTPIGQSLGSLFGQQNQQGPVPALPPTAPGSLTGLGSLIGPGGGSGATLATAATTLQTGSTTLMTAATALQAVATSLQASGSGSFGSFGGGGGDEDVDGFAGGTDSAPGGFAWVGEQGPELLNLPGGSSVTPAAAVRSGGDSHYYDMRGAVVTEDLMRKADFARAMSAAKPALIGEAVANFSEIQKRTAGGGR
jgi:hypothetical protein